MEKKSNAKLLALAAGGAVVMGALLFGLSFLTGYEPPAPNISMLFGPLSSFGGWLALILFASLTIMGLGKMSGKISANWFLSFPFSIIIIVALMFASLWFKPNGFLTSGAGRTTMNDGKYIRSVAEYKDYLAKPVLSANVPKAPEGFDFDGAKATWEAKCNICHTFDSTKDAFKTKYKKTGKIDVIVKRMQSVPGSGITDDDANKIMIYLNEKY